MLLTNHHNGTFYTQVNASYHIPLVSGKICLLTIIDLSSLRRMYLTYHYLSIIIDQYMFYTNIIDTLYLSIITIIFIDPPYICLCLDNMLCCNIRSYMISHFVLKLMPPKMKKKKEKSVRCCINIFGCKSWS